PVPQGLGATLVSFGCLMVRVRHRAFPMPRHEPAALVRQKPYISRAGHLNSSFHTLHTNPYPLPCSPSPTLVLWINLSVIRLQPNAVAHERQDGVWFQSDSSVVFQHTDISTMAELQAVFLYHLGDGFTKIRKVRIAEPPAPETKAAMGHSESEEDDFEYATSTASSFEAQEGGASGAETRSASCPRHVLPAPPPIPRVKDVPCYFQQLDLDEGASSDPLNAGMGNDYNTDGGAEIRVGHRMRNREAVQTAVKNYRIWQNAEY
ncbi:hypothetical protein PIB30_098621, partial [Stylosanthes scabra]|nr:hypothetical protein [Stylosanthes scabra]